MRRERQTGLINPHQGQLTCSIVHTLLVSVGLWRSMGFETKTNGLGSWGLRYRLSPRQVAHSPAGYRPCVNHGSSRGGLLTYTQYTRCCHAGWVPRVFTNLPLFTRTSTLSALLSASPKDGGRRQRSQAAQERAVERTTWACDEPFSAESLYIASCLR